jgi:hypothetical protein
MSKYLLLILSIILISGCWETEKGEKIGTIVKLNKQGFFIKTRECEIIRGGFNNGSGSFGKAFDFTIEDDSMSQIADKALNEQKLVKVKYHKEWFTMFRTETGDNSFLDSIEFV